MVNEYSHQDMINGYSPLEVKEQYVLGKIDYLLNVEKRLYLLSNDIDNQLKHLNITQEDFKKILVEKTQGFPWLANAIADYFLLKSNKLSGYLIHKKHPAYKSAEKVREEAKKRRLAEKQFRITKYLLEYYENLFPWLVDFRGEDLDDLIKSYIEKPQVDEEEPKDPACKWLTRAEYDKLNVVERNQLALERYWRKKKSRWEIGRDYERYIGYLYEKDGYGVYYQGIVQGLEDLGRDLIATKNKEVVVIQCKNWSQERIIHEKHICQFKGTVLMYELENKDKNIIGRFITSTKLSETAEAFAKALSIEVESNFSLQPYPSIKCNISKRTGEKIYHLPFDQQYDKTLVEEERNECYVETVKEAEKLRFRRAYRWHGESKSEN